MMPAQIPAHLYVFDVSEGKKTEEYLRIAATRFCEMHHLAEDMKLPASLFSVAKTERGKPYFPNFQDLHISITHSGAYCICAIAGQNIGIDLQEHSHLQKETIEAAELRFRKLAARFFSAREAAFVSEQDTEHRFFDLWTARESYVKYTGTGIDGGFGALCLLPEDGVLGTEQDRLVPFRWQSSNAAFVRIPFESGYTLCVCTASPCEVVVVL